MRKFTDACLDPGFGYENKDGYVRICNVPRPAGGKLVMRHRWFWELINGPIPDGFEVNHLCKNRRCCNVNHLELLSTVEHRKKDNGERYAHIIELGVFMLSEGASKEQVMEVTGRCRASINNWIREGK